MDPNAALTSLRDMALLVVATAEDGQWHEIPDLRQLLTDLAERFLALDAWTRTGGRLPDAWQARRPA
ncbi:MAG: hypothetical protein JNM56_29030 [Planctomycetia bacterium]|nr:hypothetical protein [Planctomycetia bacterium]